MVSQQLVVKQCGAAEHDGSEEEAGCYRYRRVCLALQRLRSTQTLGIYEVSLRVSCRRAGLKATEDAGSWS